MTHASPLSRAYLAGSGLASGAYAGHQELLAQLCAFGDAVIEAALLRQRREADEAEAAAMRPPARPPHLLFADQTAQMQAQMAELASHRWDAIEGRMAATHAAGIFIPWIHLAQIFQLTRQEQQLLLAALLGEIEGHYRVALRSVHDAAQCAAGPGDAPASWLTLASAASLFGGGIPGRAAVQQALAGDGPLRHWRLLELMPGTELAAMAGALRTAPMVAAYLLAMAMPQLRLGEALAPLPAAPPLAEHLTSAPVLQRLQRFVTRCGPDAPGAAGYLLHLQGADTTLLASLCAAAFEPWGLRCMRLDGRQVWQAYVAGQRNREGLVQQLRALCRDALLCNRVLVVTHVPWLSVPDTAEADPASDRVDDLFDAVFHTLLESQRYCAVLNGPAARLAEFAHRHEAHEVVPVLVRTDTPDAGLRQRIWRAVAAQQGHALDDAVIAQLVNSYLFTETQIRLAVKDAASRALLAAEEAHSDARPDALPTELLFDACRDQSHARNLSIAREVQTRHRLADIVLAPATRRWLEEILHHARHRHQVIEEWGFDTLQAHGKNLCVLFHGPSGTGKTMAASIIANELALALYKVDLASVLSKYIGETEKHLAQLFDQAEAMNVVLFFDEAESLFSRRTETRDAHDRYANLQTGYLLQRIETYPGIVILSTNLMKNMDKAFTRRFKFMLEFPFPGPDERRRLWQKAFPPALPLGGDIDLALLAERAAVSGGNINNIAVRAAFHAAADGQPLAWRHILLALEREYDKLGKVFSAADFVWDDDD